MLPFAASLFLLHFNQVDSLRAGFLHFLGIPSVSSSCLVHTGVAGNSAQKSVVLALPTLCLMASRPAEHEGSSAESVPPRSGPARTAAAGAGRDGRCHTSTGATAGCPQVEFYNQRLPASEDEGKAWVPSYHVKGCCDAYRCEGSRFQTELGEVPSFLNFVDLHASFQLPHHNPAWSSKRTPIGMEKREKQSDPW